MPRMEASTTVRATQRWWFELLACLALMAAATAVLGVSAAPPTAADLAHCPKSCGGVNISYPFGIGRSCFRPGFEVTCNNSTRPPKLFLANTTTTTEIVQQYLWGAADASIVFNIATSPGASGNYSRSWQAPGKSLIISKFSAVVIVGCGVEAFLFDHNNTGPGNLMGYCTSTCSDMAALEQEAERGGCSGIGCCSIEFYRSVRAFRLSIIQKEEAVPPVVALANATVKAFLVEYEGWGYVFSMADLLSAKINQSTIGAATAYLSPVITDQPTCRKAKMYAELYACADNDCEDYDDGYGGYSCSCANEFDNGNPYLVGGCIDDQYNPSHQKLNCSRSCGNTSIPFPFGLEPECTASTEFGLNCTSNQPLLGSPPDQYQVVNISIDEGLLFVNQSYDPKYVPHSSYQYLLDVDFSEQYGIWKWAISNTTCDVAKKHTRYACISANSECTNVTHGDVYIGYRCKCSHGYEGNPYIRNGCNGICLYICCIL